MQQILFTSWFLWSTPGLVVGSIFSFPRMYLSFIDSNMQFKKINSSTRLRYVPWGELFQTTDWIHLLPFLLQSHTTNGI